MWHCGIGLIHVLNEHILIDVYLFSIFQNNHWWRSVLWQMRCPIVLYKWQNSAITNFSFETHSTTSTNCTFWRILERCDALASVRLDPKNIGDSLLKTASIHWIRMYNMWIRNRTVMLPNMLKAVPIFCSKNIGVCRYLILHDIIMG